MSKPKFKFQIQREGGDGDFKIETGSFPQFQDDMDQIVDEIGDETSPEQIIVIRKVKNND